MDEPKTVTVDLEYPVVDKEGREIKSLTFRRMKAKDALVAEGEEGKARSGYLIFAALAGVPVEVIEDLDMEDIESVGEAIVPLMGKSARKAVEEQKKAA